MDNVPHQAKFRADRSKSFRRYGHFLIFKSSKFYLPVRFGGPTCATRSSFVLISQTVAESVIVAIGLIVVLGFRFRDPTVVIEDCNLCVCVYVF